MRAGTQGLLNNIYIKGFAKGTQVVGDAGDNPTGAWVIDGTLKFTGVTFDDVITKVQNATSETWEEAQLLANDGSATETDYATWGARWTKN